MSKRPTDMSVTSTVEGVARLEISGNMIPQAWYETITLPSGRPDVYAMLILADFVYWHKPQAIFHPTKRTFMGWERKFYGDKLQANYGEIAEKFNFSLKMTREAIYRLIELGVLIRELRTVVVNRTRLSNVPYWDIDVDVLAAITYPEKYRVVANLNAVNPISDIPDFNGVDPIPDFNHTLYPIPDSALPSTRSETSLYRISPDPIPDFDQTYTENTTKNTTKKTTESDFDFFSKNANGKSNGAGLVDAAELDGRVNRDYPQAIDREVGNLLDADQTGNGYSALNDPAGTAESPEQLAALQNYHQQLADREWGEKDGVPEQASTGLNQDAAAAVDATRQYWLNFVGGVDMAQIAAMHSAKRQASGLINNGGAGSTARTTPKTPPTPVNGNGAYNGGNILKVAPKAHGGARKGAGAKVKAGSTG